MSTASLVVSITWSIICIFIITPSLIFFFFQYLKYLENPIIQKRHATSVITLNVMCILYCGIERPLAIFLYSGTLTPTHLLREIHWHTMQTLFITLTLGMCWSCAVRAWLVKLLFRFPPFFLRRPRPLFFVWKKASSPSHLFFVVLFPPNNVHKKNTPQKSCIMISVIRKRVRVANGRKSWTPFLQKMIGIPNIAIPLETQVICEKESQF